MALSSYGVFKPNALPEVKVSENVGSPKDKTGSSGEMVGVAEAVDADVGVIVSVERMDVGTGVWVEGNVGQAVKVWATFVARSCALGVDCRSGKLHEVNNRNAAINMGNSLRICLLLSS